MAVKTIRDVVPISLLLEACRTPKPLNLCIAYRSAGINTRRMIHDTCLSPAIEPLAYKIARLCPLPSLRQSRKGTSRGIAEAAQRRLQSGQQDVNPLVGLALAHAAQAALNHVEVGGLEIREQEEQTIVWRR